MATTSELQGTLSLSLLFSFCVLILFDSFYGCLGGTKTGGAGEPAENIRNAHRREEMGTGLYRVQLHRRQTQSRAQSPAMVHYLI